MGLLKYKRSQLKKDKIKDANIIKFDKESISNSPVSIFEVTFDMFIDVWIKIISEKKYLSLNDPYIKNIKHLKKILTNEEKKELKIFIYNNNFIYSNSGDEEEVFLQKLLVIFKERIDKYKNNKDFKDDININDVLKKLKDEKIKPSVEFFIDDETLKNFREKPHFFPLVELGNYIRNDDLINNILYFIDLTFCTSEYHYKNAIWGIVEFFKKICIQFGSKNIKLEFLEKKEINIYRFKLDIKINNDVLFFIIKYDYDWNSFWLYCSNSNEKNEKLIEEVKWIFKTFEDIY